MKKSLIIILWLLAVLSVTAQKTKGDIKDTVEQNRFYPVVDTLQAVSLFKDDATLLIKLISNFTEFLKPKYDDSYLPASMIVKLSPNDSIVKNIRIKARGKSRKEMCMFPPVKLNFKTDPIKLPGYEGVDKMKMVTHCRPNKLFTTYILKEYLIYKIYNAITDYSLRVRLIMVDYVDTGKKGFHESRYGFLIEPMKLLARRLGAEEIKDRTVMYNELDPLAADRVALFNYMIANGDWQYQSSHNLKFIKVLNLNTQGAYPIPYDFDFSGFVNAEYAEPQKWNMVDNVMERDYLGFCRETPDNFNELKKEFLDAEPKIYDIIMNFEPLPLKARKRLKQYIQSFYKELKNKNAYSIITRNCRKPY